MTSAVPLDLLDQSFADRLSVAQAELLNRRAVTQLGARCIEFGDAPEWPDVVGMADEAIIETFLVQVDGLTALSESPLLEQWRDRAEAMAERVLSSCGSVGVTAAFPGYLTCSITPVSMLEGNPHLDDDQLDPSAGIGIVAINGEHAGPKVAVGDMALLGDCERGPLPVDERALEAFRLAGGDETHQGAPGQIVIFGQFGQLHAGPAVGDMPAAVTHRQLMVLRLATR